MTRNLLLTVAIGSGLLLAACGGGSDDDGNAGGAPGCDDVTLRLSHQWPEPTGEDGDFRSQIAIDFKDQVEEATGGSVEVDIFPNSTLSRATEQYDAMLAGSIDMSVLPLDYAAGLVPEWGITLMPGLVGNHDQAEAWETSEIGEWVVDNMDENGLVLLTWVWNAGGIGTKADQPIVGPDDMPSGTTMRAAGNYVEHMLADAGAGISSLPSNEIYTAMQTGVLDAAVTSTGSFASFNLQEQVVSYTSPTENTFWFMFEPLVITTETFDSLCEEQQEAVMTVGADLQEYAYQASRDDDTRVEALFADAGVNVVTMDDDAYAEWVSLAEKQWADYADAIEGGQDLIDMALDAGN